MGKGWGFLGTGLQSTFLSFMVASELSWCLWVCHLANVFQCACNAIKEFGLYWLENGGSEGLEFGGQPALEEKSISPSLAQSHALSMLPGHRADQGTKVVDLDSWQTDHSQVQQEDRALLWTLPLPGNPASKDSKQPTDL